MMRANEWRRARWTTAATSLLGGAAVGDEEEDARGRLGPSPFDSLHGATVEDTAEARVALDWLGAVLNDGGELGAHGLVRVP